MGESRNAYRVLVWRPEGKRPLGRPRRRWEDIKMDLREVGYDGRDWINLAQDRSVFLQPSFRLIVTVETDCCNLLNMEHWTGGQRGFAVKCYYLNRGRQHSLKWMKVKQCNVICPVVQQEEGENIPASSHEIIRGVSLRLDLDDDFIFQQDGAPPHFHNAVRAYLNTEMSDRWIGRAGVRDRCFMTWPPRSPDMTACDIFLWGFKLRKKLEENSQQVISNISLEAVSPVFHNNLRRRQKRFEAGEKTVYLVTQVFQDKLLRFITELPRVTPVTLVHKDLEIWTIQEYISNQAFCTYTKSYSSNNPLISSLGNYNPALDKHKRPKSVLHPLAWNDNVQDEYQLQH
ncbi:hypothetical protein ANN_16782 [Periplaneta americana]|uniref:Transposable element Tc3 transposase n=1 Tax=Periplaneta americana TaxID=6978 RepID=A0ABQ8SSF1_PERAM|nr:hypothetical protein ANN_16782 [Periplaneta americana]